MEPACRTVYLASLAVGAFVCGAFAPPTMTIGPTSAQRVEITNKNEEPCPCAAGSTRRRKFLQRAANACLAVPSVAVASNLPSSTGADLSKTGTTEALAPIVQLQRSLVRAKSQLSGSPSAMTPELCAALLRSLSQSIPREETAFKRLFDAFSTPVSYKQKFLDQNAFLVYYTRGFDGPGRPGIEEGDANRLQTLQYGSRNDAWTAMDELFAELEFGETSEGTEGAASSKGELVALFDKVLVSLDSYLRLLPPEEVEKARQQVGR